jgi:hypothetical protein
LRLEKTRLMVWSGEEEFAWVAVLVGVPPGLFITGNTGINVNAYGRPHV